MVLGHLLGGDVRRLELRLDAVKATATLRPMTAGCSYLGRGIRITRQNVSMQEPVNLTNLSRQPTLRLVTVVTLHGASAVSVE
jgi:hypothetical protein